MTEKLLHLRVAEARGQDAERGFARLDPADAERLGARTGDVVTITGRRRTVARVMPQDKAQRGSACVQIDGVTRDNAGAALDQSVEVRVVAAAVARRLTVVPAFDLPAEDMQRIFDRLDGRPVLVGDRIRGPLFKGSADFQVTATVPDGPVLIGEHTEVSVGRPAGPGGAPRGGSSPSSESPPRGPSYEDVGGLGRELARIRELVELPLRCPEVFQRLGIDAPRGVLLNGPPGCGKTLIARAVAHETEARFYAVNGPEIIHKFVGESEQHLRKIFEEAGKHAPSIIFLDEIDAIAPRREVATGEVEKRVVAQLLTLMDGLAPRRQVLVLAATNLPNNLDPALRRPGRFDREITIGVPDRAGRREILAIHSRAMPLEEDVDLDQLAALTHGFVGADLEALCREAAMVRLRHLLRDLPPDFRLPADRLAALRVTPDDFRQALREVEPSAMREVFTEIPEVRWEDVGGLQDVKRQLIEAVEWPLRHADLFDRAGVKPPRGILLSGPPGCGKTLLARAVATRTEANFISVKGPALLSKYVGESERGVREVFRKARQAAPCVVFFDEIDALVPRRGEGDTATAERVVGQFLAEMDGVEDVGGVLILGATNRPDRLDPALLRPGRFDLLIEIPPPDAAGRREVFAIGLRARPVAEDVSVDALAALADGFTGAEVTAACQRAALQAVRETVAAGTAVDAIRIRHHHLVDAVEALQARRRPTDRR